MSISTKVGKITFRIFIAICFDPFRSYCTCQTLNESIQTTDESTILQLTSTNTNKPVLTVTRLIWKRVSIIYVPISCLVFRNRKMKAIAKHIWKFNALWASLQNQIGIILISTQFCSRMDGIFHIAIGKTECFDEYNPN